MTIAEYLAQLDAKLQEMAPIIVSSSFQREIDAHLDIGFIQGGITFLDGSTLNFAEQMPVERNRYRFHYMDADNNLIRRWDSAPHHRHLSTFPFHVHTSQGVEEHGAVTLLEVLTQAETLIKL